MKMKRVQKQLSISAFTQIKRNKTDNPTSENVSIDQANLSELPSISKNDTNNHNIALTPNSNNSMSNDSDKTLTAGENDIGNYVHNLEIDDLKKEELLKLHGYRIRRIFSLLKPKEIYDFNYLG
jgi:hypothetical protein